MFPHDQGESGGPSHVDCRVVGRARTAGLWQSARDLAGGVGVVGAVGGRDAFVEAGEGSFGLALFDEGLGGHLVGGDVVGVVLDAGGELGEGGVGVALADVFHGKAIASKGIGRVHLQEFC